ncbi:DUF3237 domain-containing protein [Paenibacillus xylaniclasticus]|uniref:DUF3237 domain-containing protein n=1 Tax=Paenibacillus xylaniclasticus TaxID=588083 RepID=UPI0017535B48|nr:MULTISPECIES: DUF3237 domain-containing protein [Paenibacillus]GFN31419.1 UPF0311 protein [Paenibacillus curdlanolyticus]
MITLKPVFEAKMEVGAVQEVGVTAKGIRKMIPILGGAFAGQEISGVILPGGADWQLVRPDGVAEIEAHYTMKTHDGVCIYIMNKGYRHGPPDIMAQMAQGIEVAPEHYYFRSSPIFEVEQGKYDWLTRKVFVGTGERRKDHVLFQFYSCE